MKFLYKKSEMNMVDKFGIHLLIPGVEVENIESLHVSTEKGHTQEFQVSESTFVYVVIEGRLVFFINGEPFVAREGDIVVIPPKHNIWYAGRAKMILTCSPKFAPEQEKEIRIISDKELAEARDKYLK